MQLVFTNFLCNIIGLFCTVLLVSMFPEVPLIVFKISASPFFSDKSGASPNFTNSFFFYIHYSGSSLMFLYIHTLELYYCYYYYYYYYYCYYFFFIASLSYIHTLELYYCYYYYYYYYCYYFLFYCIIVMIKLCL